MFSSHGGFLTYVMYHNRKAIKSMNFRIYKLINSILKYYAYIIVFKFAFVSYKMCLWKYVLY